MPALRFLGHSTVRLELGGKVVLTDPVLTPRVSLLRRMVAPLRPADWADADVVLISHLHGDHLHVPSLKLLRPDVRVIVPRGSADWVRARGIRRVEEIDVGQTVVADGLRITGVYADHSGHRWGPRSTRGPDAPALGHILEADGLRIYASGDTDLFDGMGSLGDLDVALLPVWGWGPNLGPGHLDPERAATAVDLLRPRLAVPVHWGTLAVAGLTRAPAGHGERMRALLHDPPHRFAAAARAHGNGNRIRIARPGEEVPLGGDPTPDTPSGAAGDPTPHAPSGAAGDPTPDTPSGTFGASHVPSEPFGAGEWERTPHASSGTFGASHVPNEPFGAGEWERTPDSPSGTFGAGEGGT